ncbi:AAA family ATPase [Agathobaculum massiliense]|uniref:AAA family ATPase n=1 Tax=Agathobaculum massiliense TaxID=3014267 RepID=UPI000D1F8D33|nr:AAA family ATPase [Agathobaculum massiliense]
MAQIASLQIEQLAVTGFGCFADEHSWTFGRRTAVTGHNYQGKSTVADAIAYALTGAPYFGGRDLDRLQNGSSAGMRVEVTVRTEDGQTHVIRRGRHEGKTFVSLDGVLMTQERFAERFGSRDLILSLLNPLYFAEVLGGDGRKLIEQYLPAVPHEAVMEKLSEHMRGILGDDRLEMPEVYLKEKRSELKELEKDRLVLDGQMQQTDSQRARLQKELDEKKALLAHTAAALAPLVRKQEAQDFTALDAEIARLSAQYDAVQDGQADGRHAALQAELDAAQQRQYESAGAAQLQQMQSQLQLLYGKYNDEAGCLQYLQQQGVCPTCLRRLDGAAFPEVQAAFTQRLQKIQTDGTALRQQSEALAAQETQSRLQFEAQKAAEISRLATALQTLPTGAAAQQRGSIKAKIKELSAALLLGGLTAEEAQQYQTLFHEQGKLESEMEQIQKLLSSLPRGQKEALDKLDEEIRAINDKITAAKACQSERAALLFAPVKMRRAGLKLYEPMKESGELRDVFKLTWDGRDYVRLSLSERVRCGLEVAELLSRLSGKSYPLFVDNTESLCDLGAAQHGGQMILARVVPRQTLQVKALDEPQRKAG